MKKLILWLLTFGLASTVQALELKPVADDFVSPGLKLSDLAGESHDLEQYKGQVVLLQFWATYCTPCRKEMPSMNRLQEKMADTPFKILAVDMGETQAEVEAFVEEVKPEFTILMDESGQSIGDWKVFAAPMNFIIDPKGKVRYTLFGGVEWDSEEMVAVLSDLAK